MANLSRLAALKIADPAKWRKEVRALLRDSQGDLGVAAERGEVARRTLNRWIACSLWLQKRRPETAERCGECEGCGLVKGLVLAKGGPRWDGFDTEFHPGVPSVAAVRLHGKRHPGAPWDVQVKATRWGASHQRQLKVVGKEVMVQQDDDWQPMQERTIRCRPLDAEGQPVRWHVEGLPPPGGRPRKGSK